MSHHRLVIIGSWPAGHTAAIYAARADLQPLMFEWFLAGGVAAWGQLTTTTVVENFPGFPDGIQWPELMENMRQQSINAGTTILTQTVDRVDLSVRPFHLWSGTNEYTADAIIIATGATAKKLDVPGVKEYWMRGISGCAICDGSLPMFRDKVIAVVGWGDVAVEEAVHMAHFGSKVVMLVRSDKLRASKAMQEKLFANPKIEIMWNTEVTEVLGDGKIINGLKIVNNLTADQAGLTQATTQIEVWGLFFAIGHTPNTAFLDGQIPTDENGYLYTFGRIAHEHITGEKIIPDERLVELRGHTHYTTWTKVLGVFAAGDVADKKYRQAITSAGTGCMAALEAEKYLSSII